MPPTTPRTGRRTGTPPRCTPPPAGWPPGWAGGPPPPARSGPRTPHSWGPGPPPTAGGWSGSGPPPRPRPDPRPRPPSGASTWPPSGPPWPSAPAVGWPPPRPPADPPAPPRRSATAANTRMLVVRARRAGANAGSGHNSTVRPRPPKTTSPPLVARPAGGTTSGPVASSAREQESWLGAVRTAVDQAHLRSDAVAGLNTLADSLASYADWHGPAVGPAYLLTIPTAPPRRTARRLGRGANRSVEQASLEGVRARHDRRLAISGDPEGTRQAQAR